MKKKMRNLKPEIFVIDVDGVMTNGQMIYSEKGKVMKIFGPDDNDALSLLRNRLEIRFVTGDKNGFEITKRRIVNDMKYRLDLVSTVKRVNWLEKKYDLEKVIYMGDGIFDHYVFKKIGYSIAPANADLLAKKYANYVTKRNGGERAVAEACLHIMKTFFLPYDSNKLPSLNHKLSGLWTV